MQGIRVTIDQYSADRTIGVLERISRESRFKWTNDVMDRAAEIVVSNIRITAPRKSGELADSAEWYPEPDKRTVFVGAAHGEFQEYGTKPSPGRYIPAIDKRYKNDPVHLAARAVSRYGLTPALPEGLQYTEEDIDILVSPVGPATGLFVHAPLSEERRRRVVGVGFDISPHIYVAASQKIREAEDGRLFLRIQTHEFIHAMQYAIGEPLSEDMAYEGARIVDKIGMHPGVPATHFFQRAVEKSEPEIAEMAQKYIGDKVVQAAGGVIGTL